MRRRVSVLEDFIERRVEERLKSELEEMLTRPEHGLSRVEFVWVLGIAGKEKEQHGG